MMTGCERRQLSGMLLGCVVGFGFAGLLLVGCNQATPAVDPKAAEQAVRDADVTWSKAATDHNVDGVVSYYTDDATVLPANAPAVTGRQAIHDAWAAMLTPAVSLSWSPNKVVAASSGDMVYDLGSYSDTVKDATGKVVSDKGKYTAVWKKQADGSWKVESDMWSSDLPPEAPPAPAKKKK